MKTKLLLSFFFLAFICRGQNPINSFYQENSPYFALVTSLTPIDQTAIGINQIWNFDQLIEIGNSSYLNSTPTIAETTTFPNTNAVITAYNTINFVSSTSQLFTKNVGNVVSITGLKNTDLELNFITNNAILGAFPMNYGFTNNDALAGNYNFSTYSGTFTGNITTAVDASGTLTTNIDDSINTNVTRLKTVITISLNYGFFSNVGTITQTTYSYYSLFGLEFRTSTTTAVVPLASINQTETTIERYLATLLGTEFASLPVNQIQIAPNPINAILELKTNEQAIIKNITIYDSTGRIVINKDTDEKTLNISQLVKGIYFIQITSNLGKNTQKIVKE